MLPTFIKLDMNTVLDISLWHYSLSTNESEELLSLSPSLQ